MLDVHDRRHEREKTQIAFHGCEQSADPCAITCAENSEIVTTVLAQSRDELSNFHHALPQAFRVADQVGGDRQLTIPVSAWDARVMIRQMHKTSVPTKFVEMFRPLTIPKPPRRHQRVQHEYGRRAARMCARKKLRPRRVIALEGSTNRTSPGDGRCFFFCDCSCKIDIVRRSVIISRRQFLARRDRSEEHTSELQSHSFISYAVFC